MAKKTKKVDGSDINNGDMMFGYGESIGEGMGSMMFGYDAGVGYGMSRGIGHEDLINGRQKKSKNKGINENTFDFGGVGQ